MLAGAAAVFLSRPGHLTTGERGAVERLTKISTIVIAISLVMFVSSVLWFALSAQIDPSAEPVRRGWGPHLRRLTDGTIDRAIELLVALVAREMIEIILSRRRESTAMIVELAARNSLRLCLYVSFVSTMQIVAVLSDIIDHGFYNPLKIFVVIFFSSLYTAADQLMRVLRCWRDIPSILGPDSEVSGDLLIAALSNAFAWVPVIAIWSATMIAVDIAWLIAGRARR